MSERNNSGFNFPFLSKESIEKQWKELDADDKIIPKAFIEMAETEPILSMTISKVFSAERFSEDFVVGALQGAVFTWKALNDNDLPSVSLETVETLLHEWFEWNRAKTTDFGRPTPFTYCEENPALMTFLLIQDAKVSGFATGGTFMYELRKRQLHSRNISTQL